MATPRRNDHERWLHELTSLPTAAGREDRVVRWIGEWASARGRKDKLALKPDRHGNLVISIRPSHRRTGAQRPIYFAAHMDHPAFVVREAIDTLTVLAEFRGGVSDSYFKGSRVLLQRAVGSAGKPRRGVVGALESVPDKQNYGANDGAKLARVTFFEPGEASPGDVMTWDVGPARVEGDRFQAPACDDLAGVAAAVSTLDAVLRLPRAKRPDVRLILTRAEEIGFVGAIAACKARTIPRDAMIVALENSKAYAESPVGKGPIVRVGDFTSTFDPDLTYRISRIAQRVAGKDSSFKWQRKLMPGGTCEASAYQTFGYVATCVCLPLGNYHNMNESTGHIDAETISLSDYHALVRLLVSIATDLPDPALAPPLRDRLNDLFSRRKAVLAER